MRKIDIRAWYTHELSHESVKAADGKSFSSIVHIGQKYELGPKEAGSRGLSHFLCATERRNGGGRDLTIPLTRSESSFGLRTDIKSCFVEKNPFSPLDS